MHFPIFFYDVFQQWNNIHLILSFENSLSIRYHLTQYLGVNMCVKETKKKKIMERTWIKNGHLFVHMNSIQLCLCINNGWWLPIRCNVKTESQNKNDSIFFMTDEALCQESTDRKERRKKWTEMKDSVVLVCVNDRNAKGTRPRKKHNNHHKKVNSTKYLNGFWIQKLW